MEKKHDFRFGKLFRRRWLGNLIFCAGLLFIVYLISGFLIVPVIASGLIRDFIKNDLGRPVKLGSVAFNPLTFNLSLDDFYLYAPDGSVLISCEEVTVNPDLLPVFGHIFEIDTMTVNRAKINIIRNQDSTFNFDDISANLSALLVDSTDIAETWVLKVNRLGVIDMDAVYEDLNLEPHFTYEIDSIRFHLRDLHLSSPDTATWKVQMRTDGGGWADAAGTFRTDEIISDFSFRVSAFSIKPFQPVLSRFTHLRIDSGTVNAYGDIHLQLDSLYEPGTLRYRGNVSGFDLRLYDLLKNETFLGWDTVITSGISAQINPLSVNIAKITALNCFARIAIAEDKSFNAVDVMQPLIQTIKADTTLLKEVNSKKINLNIGRLAIVRSGTYFSDLSLPLPFAVHVHSLHGDIVNISPENSRGAQLDVEGVVDQYGYAAARGNLDLFYPFARTDIAVVFRNIELASLSPYSAKFAGYALESGKMSADLSYKIRDAKLQGGNQILLDNLTLGEEIQSEEATGLPVKLAIALMQDSEGKIDLDVDIAGDLNDPQMDISQLLWQGIKNVILNVVSTPFIFLGNLLGFSHDEELQIVQFVPGSAELLPHQQEKLINLSKAMKARPEIKLEVYGAWDKVRDKKSLQKDMFNALYESRLKTDGKMDTTGQILSRDILEKLYRETFSGSEFAKLQVTYGVGKQVSEKDSADSDTNKPDLHGYFDALREQLVAVQAVSGSELRQLAQKRARAIRIELVEIHGLAEKRVVIMEPEVFAKTDSQWVNCRLSIGAM